MRFIPTGVGNSCGAKTMNTSIPVHPHGRGELVHAKRCREARGGSSPRAWGTLALFDCLDNAVRFIPTGVGNSPGENSDPSRCPVHPHGRGELKQGLIQVHVDVGSSPRAWGTLSSFTASRADLRFIPTGVGNSRQRLFLRCGVAVHPHGRGKLNTSLPSAASVNGSSPRAWGTLHIRQSHNGI